jgi:hypothetical protein
MEVAYVKEQRWQRLLFPENQWGWRKGTPWDRERTHPTGHFLSY